VKSSGTTCRSLTGDCDIAEQCNGTAVTCPADTGNTGCNFRTNPQIAPTGTTCQQYRDNQSGTLGSVLYTLTKGNPATQVINSISPGVFFLYDGVEVSSSGSSITVTQSNDSGWTRSIGVQQDQIILYNLNCVKVQGVRVSSTSGNVTISGVPAGSYILSVKYDPGTLSGFHPPTQSATYSFQVKVNNTISSGSASVLVKQKK